MHFISGLPRSGSTLLAAVLAQNPRIHAGMTSPVASLYTAMETAMAQHNENAVFIDDRQRRAMLAGIFDSFYAAVDAEIVFDTNRMWTTRLPALVKLFPRSKVICCVRDVAWIIDSFERLQRSNPFELSSIYGFDAGSTVYSRASAISHGKGVVGHAYDGLKEALSGEQQDHILLVEYEDLCKNPALVMKRIYDFIGEDHFQHDFSRVEYSASEFDRNLGARGLHDVRGKIEWRPRNTVLPHDLFARYQGDQFWRVETRAA